MVNETFVGFSHKGPRRPERPHGEKLVKGHCIVIVIIVPNFQIQMFAIGIRKWYQVGITMRKKTVFIT